MDSLRPVALILALAVRPLALAQAPAPAPAAPAASGYKAVVTADNVYVRSGPSVQSAYPFARLNSGSMVDVADEEHGWARIRTSGPAFANIQGYVLAGDAVSLSADGSTLTVSRATELRAPNIGADGNPDASFKAIGQLPAGTTTKVLGQVSGEREKAYKVAMPDTATGWINLAYLRRAAASDAAPPAANPETEVSKVEGADVTMGERATPPGTTVDVTVKEAAKPAEAKPAEKPAPLPPPVKTEAQIAAEKRRAAFKDLEVIWVKVKAEPLESSELVTLKERYVILMADPELESDIRAMGKARVEQLEIQMEAQQRIQELKALRAQLDADSEQLKALRLAMEARTDYTAVGVLNASSVYDGTRLPLLFRLTDPASGQTVAYLAAKDPNMISTMLGTLVGVRGTQRFDEALKVNVIDPGTIDILTIRKEAQVSPAN